ncbi:MAG: glycoside hydrolase family 3 N-terminal domain-containing protein [Acidobacteriota bacterium]
MLDKISSLPLEQKIGQLFFIGLPGVKLDEEAKLLLNEVTAGGVCLFARNIREAEDTRKLLDDLREFLPVEPILSLDQEGGLVDRLRRIIPPMPSASSLKTIENAKKLAEITAQVIRILGFNTNFAPVVDIPTKESIKTQNGLQSRFLGDGVEEVIRLSESYLKTLQDNNILGCPKHFPGLGASEVDSHEELPIVNSNLQILQENDLVPYKKLLSETHQVMIAHAAYPNLDLQERDQNGKLLPSSLSFNIVTKLLRQEIGFKGLVVTDDLEMGAILKNYGIGEACKMAFRAGVDMFLICANTDSIREAYKVIFKAIQSGEISEARLNESLQRIAEFKKLIDPPLPFDKNRLTELSKEIEKFNEKLK